MRKIKWLIIGILLAALAVRLPYFGQIPLGVNRDEAALGYNAWSILKTGKDEHGVTLPLSIKSFGDQKLPGYVYGLLPFVAFGTDAVFLRLPSFLAGIAVIVLVGRISFLLSQEMERKYRLVFSLLSMLLVALSPWGNHFSRVAYEAHLAMAFFLSGILAWLEARQRPKLQLLLLPLSAVGFSFSMLTYHSYQVLVPIAVIGLAFIFQKEVRVFDRRGVVTGFLIGVLTIGLLFFGGIWEANQTKIGGINPFSPEVIERRYFLLRQAFPGDTLMDRFIANRWTEKGALFFSHIVESLASDFLFTTTTSHRVHNQSGIGNFHVILAPFMLIGFAEVWQRRQQKTAQFFLLLLLGSLIAPALTISPQHTVRLSPIFPLLEMLGALGGISLWHSIRSHFWRSAGTAAFFAVLALSVLRYEIQYLVLAPQRDSDHSHDKWHILATALSKYAESADELITQSPTSSPYIWYVLQNKIDPNEFRQSVEYYPADKEGFLHVRRVGKVTFEVIDWNEVYAKANDHTVLLFFQPQEFDSNNPRLRVIETLSDRSGKPVFSVIEVIP